GPAPRAGRGCGLGRGGFPWWALPRRLGRRELPEGQGQIAQEAGQVELLLPFEQPAEGGRHALERAAAQLLHDPRKIGEQPPLRFEPVVKGRGEGEGRGGLLDVAAYGIAQRGPAPPA